MLKRDMILKTKIIMSQETFVLRKTRYEEVHGNCEKPCNIIDFKTYRTITCPHYKVRVKNHKIVEHCHQPH